MMEIFQEQSLLDDKCYVSLLLSPDWDSAANDLNKAAVCFKVNICSKLAASPDPAPEQVACSWEECKAAHLRACEAYANSGRSGHDR